MGCSPAARRLLTISERPIRERSAGTAMAAGGARSGAGSLVTKRTRTWREGSASMAAAAAAADGKRARMHGDGVAAAGRVGEGRVLGVRTGVRVAECTFSRKPLTYFYLYFKTH